MPLATNQFLRDRYRINGLIGQGGMGAVYDAHDTSLNIRCAIKENLIFTEAAQKQFESEARLLASLRHPNLPRVTDHFFIPMQGQYLVMDFIEGEDLKTRQERLGMVPAADLLRWSRKLLSALAYLHARHIVHRDIKPGNIKITPEDEPVLVDFGIAKSGSGVTLSTTGARGFTPGFTSPEQYGVGVGTTDGRSDLYSFGATLYTLLVGEPPVDALGRMMKPQAFSPLSQRAPATHPGLLAAIDRAMQLDPDERFATADEMALALRGQAAGTAPFGKAVPPPVAVPPPLTVSAPPAPEVIILEQPFHLELVHVPAGEFLMGSDLEKDENARPEELPQHRVAVAAFYIGKYPITNAQYALFVRATGHRPPGHWRAGQMPHSLEHHPVVMVSWSETLAFCEWLSQMTRRHFRLPTEAEWEKAARGTAGRIFPWGNTWSDKRLNNSEKRGATSPIGKYSPPGDSPYGVTDMLGNVWEWCLDGFNPNEYQTRGLLTHDPQGPTSGFQYRVMKGGTWLSSARAPRCAQRSKSQPEPGLDFLGFRVVMVG